MRTNDREVVLEAKGLTKSFGGNAVLTGVDFKLHRGEVVLLQGANGSGKTTLLNILTGNLKPDGGTMRQHETLGRTWQDVRLFASQTLADNIAMATPRQPGENPLNALFLAWKTWCEENRNAAEVAELLGKMGLADRANVSGSGAKIAEAKFVAMFRAIRAGAKVLFLDEPLAGLDHAETEAVLSTLRNLVKQHGLTLVVIEHALNIPKILQIATTVWTLKNGRLSIGTIDTADEATGGELREWLRSIALDGTLREMNLPGGAHLAIASRRVGVRSMLVVSNYKVNRGARPVIAVPVSFSLKEGDIAILEAPNGWGKTTLLESIAGLVPAVSGTVEFLGEDMTTLPAWKRSGNGLRLKRSGGGLFTQMTVLENARLNHVLDPILPVFASRKAGSLSGGESRRLSFETAIGNPNTNMLMLDEPFQALDIIESARVRSTLSNNTQTFLITTPENCQ